MRKHIYLIITLIALFSCTSRHAKEMLRTSMSLLDTRPELALTYLDSIKNPRQDLGREDFRQYTVTKVQALYKSYRSIKYEDDIFEAQTYYNRKADNPKMIAISNLYSGCVLEEKDEKEQAMNAYKLAFEAAIKTGDSLIMGRIQQYMGRLLSSQGLHEKAIEAYRKAAYINKGMPEKQANNFSAIGRMFLIMGETDSAFFYFEKGIEIAKQSDKQEMLCQLYQNLGIAYRETEDYEKSEKYLRLSLQMNIDSGEITRYNLSFASLYLLMGKSDSCTYYENLLKKEMNTVKDEKLLASIYSFLSRKAVSENQYDSAYYYIKKYSGQIENITERRLKQSVFEVQEKYDYEKIRNGYQAQLLTKQHLITAMMILLLVSAIVIIYFLIRRSQRSKEELSLKNELIKYENENTKLTELRNEQEDKILYLENKMNDMECSLEEIDRMKKEIEESKSKLSKTVNSLQQNLQQKYMLIYNITNIENDKRNISEKQRYDKLRQMFIGQDKTPFDALIYIFNEGHPGLSDAIKNKYPDLTDTEFKVCIMSFSSFSSQETATLLGQSTNTVNIARTYIRKKLGIGEKGGDISKYILENLKNY